MAGADIVDAHNVTFNNKEKIGFVLLFSILSDIVQYVPIPFLKLAHFRLLMFSNLSIPYAIESF